MGKVIGIDLGTTNSCVAFIENGEPVVIPNQEGARTTPSVVAFTKEGERRVGAVAKRQSVTNPENTIYSVKRLMGRRLDSPEAKKHAGSVPYHLVQALNGDAWVQGGDREYSPPEISAMVLAKIKEIAESYLGEPVDGAVITVPAYFDDAQRQATRDAGAIAGLDVKRIINEPTAAALAYGFQNRQGGKIAVYDLGGGTFDISVLEIMDGVFKVLATNGDTHLGGEDFDTLVIDYLAEHFVKENPGIDLRKDRISLQRLKEQAERAKHELSSALETEVNLPFIAADATGPKHLVLTMKRSDLEILCLDLIERTIAPCRKALADAGVKVTEIDEVVLVGGMTRMPLVQKKVADFFGKTANKGVNPDEVVAVGAAIQGASMTGALERVLLLDVTPLSLGVEVGGGIFHKLIPRNTTIPTSASEVFTTSLDNQPFVPVHVLQGEREMAVDNKTLSRFELDGIEPAPRGVPQIEVRFEIDADGIVHVNAKDLGTGKEQKVKVVAASGLSADQIERLVKEGEKHKDDDEQRRELAELRNTAEGLIYNSEKAVEECADLVSAEVLTAMKTDIQKLRIELERGDIAQIKSGLTALETSAYKIAEAVYGG